MLMVELPGRDPEDPSFLEADQFIVLIGMRFGPVLISRQVLRSRKYPLVIGVEHAFLE